MSPLDWDKPRGIKRCFVTGGGEERAVFVALVARLPNLSPGGSVKSGYSRQVGSKQHGYCKAHGEQVYDQLLHMLEGSGSA